MILGSTLLMRLAIAPLINLYMHDNNVTGLQLVSLSFGLSPLGSKVIIPNLWEAGNILFVYDSLATLCIKYFKLDQKNL